MFYFWVLPHGFVVTEDSRLSSAFIVRDVKSLLVLCEKLAVFICFERAQCLPERTFMRSELQTQLIDFNQEPYLTLLQNKLN